MPKRRGKGDSEDAQRKRPSNGGRGGYGGGEGGGGRPERDEPSGEHQIFVDMVQRRMGGGAPPSAAAYARAMRQWQQMPGAIGFTAVPNLPDEPPPGDPPPEQPPNNGKRGGQDEGQPN